MYGSGDDAVLSDLFGVDSPYSDRADALRRPSLDDQTVTLLARAHDRHHAPRRVFDWYNHLLGCSFCNSHAKGGLFPRDEDGAPLLIDPTADEPVHHLRLSLTSGEYHCLDTLAGCAALLTVDDKAGAEKRMVRSRRQPLADVLQELRRIADRPSAALVVGGEVALAALRTLYGQPAAEPVFIPRQTSRHEPDCRSRRSAVS
ncbi:hypothetical protein [Streptomyces sp. NPDC059850]|uniref:hypothetical protein n=1 Tax=Streptomyces sp. NPDC059850 TaxID=3346970 RepID=UPI0036475F8A